MSVFYSTDYQPGFPFYCFDYDASGRMGDEQEIEDEAYLTAVFDHQVPKALREKRRFIICDLFGYCLLHIEDGKIVFPLRDHLNNPGDLFTVRDDKICKMI